VRQTTERVLNGGRLSDVLLTNENGRLVYELEMRQARQTRAFTVAADGRLLARQVLLEELPLAARDTVARETAGGTLEAVYWFNDEGEPGYYVEYVKSRQANALVLALDGWLLSRKVTLAQLPAPVARGLRDKLKGRDPLELYLTNDDGEWQYEVTELFQGRERLWVFATNGTVLAEPVELSQVPELARQVLTRVMGHGRLIRVLKFEIEGKRLYEIAFELEEKRHACAVDAQGQISYEEMPLASLPDPLRKAMTDQAQGGFVVKIEKSPGANGATYDLYLRAKGKVEILTFAADGTLLPQ
jgi:uncharacterized membrane protein YkoI